MLKQTLLIIIALAALTSCSIRDDSADIAQCRDIASKRVAKSSRSVDATYSLCAESKAEKRQSQENTDTAFAITDFILDLFR